MSSGGFTAPKGYRYNPSDEDLLSELKQKNHCKDSQITTIIPEIDVCKYEPRQLPELAFTRAENLVRKFFPFFFFWIIREESWHSQRKCHFFTPLDYKYTKGDRVNRATGEGFWKITSKDRAIKAPDSKAVIGGKRILTFHKRGVTKAQKDQKTGWVIHEYFLIQESCDPLKQIGEYVVCCLKYKSDDSDHDKDAPFCNRGSSSRSMASNVENQAEENWVSEELANVVPILNGNESETVGGMITEEEEYLALKELEDALQVPIGNPHDFEGMQTDPCCTEQNDHSTSVEGRPEEEYLALKELEDALQVPIGNPHDFEGMQTDPCCTEQNDHSTSVEGRPEEEYLALKELEDALQVPIGNPHDFEGMQTDPCCTEQNDHSTSVEGRPDRSNSSDMIEELLDDPENLDSLFDPPAPPQLDQLHQSPMYTTNVRKHECRKRAYPFEHDDPSFPKKNNISTDDGNKLVSNSASNSESQAANVIPEGYSQPGANLGSAFDFFLPKDYVYTQPSINGGPRDFPNDNNFIELDDLPSFDEGIDFSQFSDRVIDGGRGVTSNRNTYVVYGSENDYSALASGASLHHS